jgi:hypothetical protein
METSRNAGLEAEAEPVRRAPSVLTRFLRSRSAVAGAILLGAWIFVAIAAPLLRS